MRAVVLLLALSGCDAVFGLDDTELPECFVDTDQFEDATPTMLRDEIDVFSFTAARDHAIASIRGITVETDADGANPRPIDIEPMYPMVSVAIEPNSDYFMFTASIEPPEIMAITKQDGAWKFDPRVPKGFIAGTPTNRMSGDPVRVIVRLAQAQLLFQEYERDADGKWFTVGDRFELRAVAGANMTHDGRAIVFDGYDDADNRAVYVAQRGSRDERFGAPQRILKGAHSHPQLFGSCDRLYTIDEGSVLTARSRR